MSLLDENFDLDIKDLIISGLKGLFNPELEDDRCTLITFLPFRKSYLSDATIIVADFEPSKSGKYYIGYDLLDTPTIKRIKFKLFDPDYVVPFTKVKYNPLYRHDEAVITKLQGYTIMGSVCDGNLAWLKLDVQDIINGGKSPIINSGFERDVYKKSINNIKYDWLMKVPNIYKSFYQSFM